MQELRLKLLEAESREEGWKEQNKELLDRLTRTQAAVKVDVPLQSQESEQSLPTAPIELK